MSLSSDWLTDVSFSLSNVARNFLPSSEHSYERALGHLNGEPTHSSDWTQRGAHLSLKPEASLFHPMLHMKYGYILF